MSTSMFTPEFKPMKREPTMNRTGFTFDLINAPIEDWSASEPISLPVADLGACYGVHTLHALSKGRDVIAADMDAGHISELKSRVENQAQNNSDNSLGKLVATHVARIPRKDLLKKESVAGILISELLHFLEPGEPLEVMKHCADWLIPGGTLVIMSSSLEKTGWSTLKLMEAFENDGSVDPIRKAIHSLDEDELLTNPPGIVYLGEEVRKIGGDKIYMLSVRECEIMCRRAGLEVVRCEYIHTGKYGTSKDTPETVLLVAKKPSERGE